MVDGTPKETEFRLRSPEEVCLVAKKAMANPGVAIDVNNSRYVYLKDQDTLVVRRIK